LRFFLAKNALFSSYGISQQMQAANAVELTTRCPMHHPQRTHPGGKSMWQEVC
jgi:hypothetical protein